MENRKVIYYDDELNNEFSTAKIEPRVIDKNYKYKHGIIWEMFSILFQNVLTVPIKVIYSKIKFRITYVGKEKLKPYKKQGYFVYGNHTQAFADTFITSNCMYPKRNFFIVNPENVSIKGLGNFVQMLGAIPLPGDRISRENFLKHIKYRIEKGNAVTIFPEAHIWPYYTKIRPFIDGSFKYAVDLNVPAFAITNTYKAYGKDNKKVKIVTYVDGPFFPDASLERHEARKGLRDKVYEVMCERSKNSDIEVIEYIKNN
ncbi:MAG: 1-acyl-sn-glycerol-3-phosphate acyltransferase [Clostridia bacterium]|nr:1-acyl-sn-glycerol-3-phosphate acyltransferase [Clostridia bacterium]